MKTKTILGLFMALVVLLGLFWLRSRPVEEVGVSQIAAQAFKNPKELDRLLVKSPGYTYEISLMGGAWKIKVDNQWVDADGTVFNDIVDKLRSLSSSEVVAEGTDLNPYGLSESQRVEVKGFHGNDPLGEVWLGSPGASGSGMYVKYKDHKELFLAEEDFRSKLDQSPDALRDNRLFGDLLPEAVQSFTLTTLSGSMAIQKKDKDWVFEGALGGKAQTASVDAFLKSVVDMKSAGAPEPATYQDLISGSPEIELVLQPQSGSAATLKIWPTGSDASKVGVQSSFLNRPASLFSYQVGALRKTANDFKDKSSGL